MLAFLYTIFIKENNAFSQEHRQLPVVSSSMFGLVLSYLNEFLTGISTFTRKIGNECENQKCNEKLATRRVGKFEKLAKNRVFLYTFFAFFSCSREN